MAKKRKTPTWVIVTVVVILAGFIPIIKTPRHQQLIDGKWVVLEYYYVPIWVKLFGPLLRGFFADKSTD